VKSLVDAPRANPSQHLHEALARRMRVGTESPGRGYPTLFIISVYCAPIVLYGFCYMAPIEGHEDINKISASLSSLLVAVAR
jgi:hypothetical protein